MFRPVYRTAGSRSSRYCSVVVSGRGAEEGERREGGRKEEGGRKKGRREEGKRIEEKGKKEKRALRST